MSKAARRKASKDSNRQNHQAVLETLEPRMLLDTLPLPLPSHAVPVEPALQPSVVTAGGQRFLLSYFNNNTDPNDDVEVSFDYVTDKLVSNRPGWWIENYPLEQIKGLEGLSTDEIAKDVFGAGSAADVKNWYVMTPVDAQHPAIAEPAAQTGPAPIVPTDLSDCNVLVVDNDTSHTGNAATDSWVQDRIAAAQNVSVDPTIYSTVSAAVAAFAPSLVGYWRFDAGAGTTAYDDGHAAGTPSNGTLSDSSMWQTGKIGDSLQFNGTSQYVQVADSATVRPTTSITLACWAKAPSNGNWNSSDTFISKYTYSLGPVSGSKAVEFRVNFSGYLYPVSYTPPSGFDNSAWHYYAGTYDGSVMRLYVDGVQVASVSHPGNLGTTTDPLYIGRTHSSGTPDVYTYFGGSLDEVRIYSKALTATDVASLYNLASLSVTSLNRYGSGLQSYAMSTSQNLYSDTGSYTYGGISNAYIGQTFIQTANADNSSSGAQWLSFTTSSQCAVYVWYDSLLAGDADNGVVANGWLDDFTPTGDTMIANGHTYTLYSKVFSAGTVTLGGNTLTGSNPNSANMYTVIVQAMNESDFHHEVLKTTVVLVTPGSGPYREPTCDFSSIGVDGTSANPIIIEGVRDANGNMPVFDGSTMFPTNAWTQVDSSDVWYASLNFGGNTYSGGVSENGNAMASGDPTAGNESTLIQRSLPDDLQPGEDCINYASSEFLNLHGMSSVAAVDQVPDQGLSGLTWTQVDTTVAGTLSAGNGVLDFGTSGGAAANKVYWASTWLWVPPTTSPFDYQDPGVVTSPNDQATYGPFSVCPHEGTQASGQINQDRIWVNGQMIPAAIYSTAQDYEAGDMFSQAFYSDGGYIPGNDKLANFTLQGGWNHLVFEFDTSTTSATSNGNYQNGTEELTFQFQISSVFGNVISQATEPADLSQAPTGTAQSYISQYSVLSPISTAGPENRVYVRLDGGQSPNAANMDMVKTSQSCICAGYYGQQLNIVGGNYVQVRGLEGRDNASFGLGGKGDLMEGNTVLDSSSIGAGGNNPGEVPFVLAPSSLSASTLTLSSSWAANIIYPDYPIVAGTAICFVPVEHSGTPMYPDGIQERVGYNTTSYSDVYYLGLTATPGVFHVYADKDDALAGNDNYLTDMGPYGSDNVTVDLALSNTSQDPIIIRNNWILNAKHDGIQKNNQNNLVTADNENGAVDGRIGFIYEYNYISNSNWAGYCTGWDAGNEKSFSQTDTLWRYNTYVGGSAMDSWLDGTNFGNEYEGNLFIDCQMQAIGIEASPGPNLIANNIISGMISATIQNAIGPWSTNQTWAVNNTVDSRMDPKSKTGIQLNWGDNGLRDPLWTPYATDPKEAYVNNVVMGCEVAVTPDCLCNPCNPDVDVANYTDNPDDVYINIDNPNVPSDGTQYLGYMGFVNQAGQDYRLLADSPLNNAGAAAGSDIFSLQDDTDVDLLSLVPHDFYGLLRNIPGDSQSAGATRAAVTFTDPGTVVEWESSDGDQARVYMDQWTPGLETARWEMDESSGTTASNSGKSGSALNGTVVNGGTWTTSGYLNGGLALDGTNQYVNVPYDSTENFAANSAFTISAWVKPANFGGSSTYTLVSHGTGYDLSLSGANNGLSFTINGGTPICPTADQTALLGNGSWHLVTATRDASGTASLYIDGTLVGSGSVGTAAISNSDPLYIGRGGGYFNGTLDDVRMFNGAALTQADIQDMYNATTISISATQPNAAEPSTNGTFRITREGPTTFALTANFTVSGAATNGASYDYVLKDSSGNTITVTDGAGQVTIPAGQSYADVTLFVNDDSYAEPTESVILTLTSSANYTVGSSNVATANIADNDQPTVSIVVTDDSASESGDPATFTVSRPSNGDLSSSLTVNLTISGTATNGADYQLFNDLTALWKFDDGTGTTVANASSVGSALNGTLSNGGTWGAGYLNGGLTLNGTNQYVNVPYDSTEDFAANSAFTISAWVKPTGFGSSSTYTLVSHGTGYNLSLAGGSTNKGLSFTVNGTTIHVNSDSSQTDETTLLGNGSWHLVTAMRDATGTASLYVDGVLVGSGSVGTAAISNSDPLYIGRGSGYFNGSLDNVQIFSRALSIAEIRNPALSLTVTIPAGQSSTTITLAPIDDLVTEGQESATLTLVGGPNYTVSGTNYTASANIADTGGESGLVGHWTLDDGAGSTAVNTGSAANANGTLVNGAAWDTGLLNGDMVLNQAGAQYVNVAYNSAFDFGANAPFTISAWVRPTGFGSSSTYTLVSHGSGGSYYDFSLAGGSTDKGLSFTVNGTTIYPTADQTALLGNGSWHLVTATRDASGNGVLYIDGMQVGSGSVGTGAAANGNPLYIGRNGSSYYNGSLDDVRVYNTCLSGTEVGILAGMKQGVSIVASDAYAGVKDDTPQYETTYAPDSPYYSQLGTVSESTGQYTVTRTGDCGKPLTVYYQVSGDAAAGTDYQALSGQVTFLADQSTATITIQPLSSTVNNVNETSVIVTLLPGPVYEVSGASDAATVTMAGTNDLLAEWKLDGTGTTTTAVNTGSVANINGALSGFGFSPSPWQSGVDGNALYFNGNDQVNIPYNSALDFGVSDAFTISLWVKLDPSVTSLPSGNMYFMANGNNEAGLYLPSSWYMRGLGFNAYYGVRADRDYSSILLDHDWHQITATRNEDGIYRVYMDGHEIMAGNYLHTSVANPGNGWVLGALDVNGHNRFKGWLDDVQIYGRALSAVEAQALFADATQRVTISGGYASETGSRTGSYVVTRIGGSDLEPLTVNYTVTGAGSATYGSDYTNTLGGVLTNGSVTIPAGQTSAIITTVTPVDDGLAEGDETTQQLMLSPSANYAIGSQYAAVTILDNDEVVSVTAVDATATEHTPTNYDTGTFRISRGTVTSGALQVYYTFGGTATGGSDYSMPNVLTPGIVTIPDGSAYVDITITPVDDNILEGNETVQLTIANDPARYTVDSQHFTDTVTIFDDLARVAPSGLSATTVSTSQINLSWTDNCSNETGFDIERAPDNNGSPGTFAQIGTVGANVTTYNDNTGLSEGTKYWYQVLAYNSSANSAYSNQSSAVTLSTVTVTATDAAETGTDGVFTVTRTGNGPEPLTVNFTIGGSADSGDYQLSSDDLRAWWQFDDGSGSTAANSSTQGAALNGTVSGATWGGGEYNGGLTFDGIDDSVSVPSNSAFNFGTGAFTISAWVKFTGTSVSNDYYPIIQRGDDQDGVTWELFLSPENGLCLYANEFSYGLSPNTDQSATFNDHNWHMVTVSRDAAGNSAIYIDGQNIPCNTTGLAGADGDSSLPVTIGSMSDGGWTTYFPGSIDDVRVYDSAVTPSQILGQTSIVSVTIPAGQTSATVTVIPVDDKLIEGNETVQLTVSSSSAYAVGSPSNGTVTIADDLADVAPSDLSATTASASQINLSWTDNCDNETGFKIDRATDSGFTQDLTTFTVAAPNTTSYQSTGLTDGTTYYYRVRAYGVVDSNNSATASATTTLMAPTGLDATAVSSSEIDLAWTDHSDNETGFKIERAPDNSGSPGTFVQIGTVGANVTTYNDTTDLTGDTKYWYQVRAYETGAPDSAYSNQSSDTTAPPPLSVYLQAVNLGDGTYSVQIWAQIIDGKADEGISDAAFTVYAPGSDTVTAPVTSGGGAHPQVVTTWGSALDNSDPNNPDYLTFRAVAKDFNHDGSVDAVEAAFGDVDYVNPNLGSTAFMVCAEIWTVDPSQDVSFAVNADGRYYDAQTGGKVTFPQFQTTGVTVLAAPTMGTCDNITATSIRVNWTDNSAHENGYVVERSLDGSTGWTAISGSPFTAGTQTATDSGRTEGTTYYYRVTAVTSSSPSGDSVASSNGSATTLLAAPTMGTCDNITATSIRVNWTDNSAHENGYKVERSLDGSTGWTAISGSPFAAGTQTATDSGRTEGTAYYYRVTAVTSSSPTGDSVASSNGSATTLLAAPTMGTCDNITATSIRVNWTDNSAHEYGYKVERSLDGSTGWTAISGSPFTAGTQTATDSGRTEGTAYYYRVTAVTSSSPSGDSVVSSNGSATTLLAAPTIGTCDNITATSIRVNWTDNSAHEYGYKVERSLDGSTGWTAISGSPFAAGTQTATDSGRTEGTAYYYRVTAVTSSSPTGDSVVSSNAGATTLLAAPTIGTCDNITATSIRVNWTDNSAHENGYKVERSPDGSTGWTAISGSPFAAGTQTATDSSRTEGTAYYYRVTAVTSSSPSGDSVVSSNGSATTLLAAPTMGTCTNVTAAQVQVNWTDNSAHENGYVVERSLDGSTGWTVISGSPFTAGTQTATDSGRTEGTTYYYRVTAVTSSSPTGDSVASSNGSATTLLAAPTMGTCDNITATSIRVNWTDNSAHEYGYKVERSLDGSTGWTAISGSPFTAGTQTATDSGRTEGTTYYYRVTAVTSSSPSGDSVASSNGSATTLLAAPTMGTCDNITATSIRVNWTDNSAHEYGYKVERSLDGSTGWTAISGSPFAAGTQTATDSGRTEGTAYYYRVTAVTSSSPTGDSVVSSNAGATTLLAAPTIGTCDNITATSIRVNWTDNSAHENGYKVERSLDGSTGWTAISGSPFTAGTQTATDSGRTEGTTYYYRVTAVTSSSPSGDSAVSSNGSATTLLAAPTMGTCDNITATSIRVNWTDNSAHENGYVVERSLDGSTGWTAISGSPFTAGTQTATDSSRTEGTTYYYRVTAVTSSSPTGDSVASSNGSATTLLAAPTMGTCDNITATSIRVNWTDNSAHEYGYKVERSLDGSTGWMAISGSPFAAGTQTATDSGRTEGTAYYYRVTAVTSSSPTGDSVASSNGSATTLLAAPTMGTCTNVTAAQVQVNWTDNSAHENGYKVERSYDGSTGWTTVHTGGSGSGSMSWTDTAVLPSTTYYYRVTATTSSTPTGDSVASSNSPVANTPSNELGKVLSDYWYGTTGAAWNSQWSYINSTTNATVALTVQSNQGRASFTRSSGTMSGLYLAYVNTNNLIDSDQKVTFTANTTGTYFSLIARKNNSADSYYFARAYVNGSSGTLAIYKRVSGTDTSLTSTTFTVTAGTTYNLRFQCVTSGSTTNLKADIWSASTNEPTTTWTVSTTDASFQSVSGWCGMRYNLLSTTSTTAQTFTTDNYQAIDASSGNSTLLDTFQGGTSTNWTVRYGTWSVATNNNYSNRYYLSSNPGGTNNKLGAYSTINSPASVGDFTFTCEAEATSATGNYAVVFGYQDANNYYYMNFDGNGTAGTKLYKVVGGTASVVASYSGRVIADTNAHQIKITRLGRSISVWYDGQNLLSNVLDDSLIGGRIGVGAYTGTAYFDNVTVG